MTSYIDIKSLEYTLPTDDTALTCYTVFQGSGPDEVLEDWTFEVGVPDDQTTELTEQLSGRFPESHVLR